MYGPRSTISQDAETLSWKIDTDSPKTAKHNLETSFVHFVYNLQQLLAAWFSKLDILTELRRNGAIFRAHPHYRGRVWRDWVIIDWAGFGKLPAKLWGFVNLSTLPPNTGAEHGSCKLQPGVYAVVESAVYNEDEAEIDESDIFVPITKEIETELDEIKSNLKFFLADVDSVVCTLDCRCTR